MGRYPEAEKFFQRSIHANPHNIEALEAYAGFLNQRGKNEALHYFQRSVLEVRQAWGHCIALRGRSSGRGGEAVVTRSWLIWPS
jgi:tetratricopeptide (TPR) repeat protein